MTHHPSMDAILQELGVFHISTTNMLLYYLKICSPQQRPPPKSHTTLRCPCSPPVACRGAAAARGGCKAQQLWRRFALGVQMEPCRHL
jgi:hypothetical protein